MNNEPENFDRPIPIVRLILVAAAIACIAAILLQNLQPLVTVYFLGRSTIPIPLSLAILAAFLSGAIAAAIANSIANWLSRRNDDTDPDRNSSGTANNKDAEPKDTRRSQVKEEKKVEDSTTAYPRSPSDRTTKLQDDDDDDYDDDDDDDDRDEIFVKYIKR
jgi:uncharacterized integral membrane protein